MTYKSILLVVKDIQKSKEFYKNILGLDVVDDFGANVVLTHNISLQTLDTWKEFIEKKEVIFNSNSQELYFEEDNFDDFVQKLYNKNIDFVHNVKEHSWGQKVVRFYDLDQHIIEVGEPMKVVVKRFLDSGLSVEDTAKRMGVSVEYIKNNKN